MLQVYCQSLFVARFEVPPNIEHRFWKFVNKTDTCWLWTGATASGYGTFCLGNSWRPRQVGAHCYAFYLANGYVSDHFVLHTCDVKKCVRFDHLFEGTQKDNVHDAIAKGRLDPGAYIRSSNQKGSANHGAKLSEESVALIWYLHKLGFTQAEIMRETGVSRAQVWCIVHQVSWKSFTDTLEKGGNYGNPAKSPSTSLPAC